MKSIQIQITRNGHTYTYSRTEDDQISVSTTAISADRAEQICTANEGCPFTVTGDFINFDLRPSAWSVTYFFWT